MVSDCFMTFVDSFVCESLLKGEGRQRTSGRGVPDWLRVAAFCSARLDFCIAELQEHIGLPLLLLLQQKRPKPVSILAEDRREGKGVNRPVAEIGEACAP